MFDDDLRLLGSSMHSHAGMEYFRWEGHGVRMDIGACPIALVFA
jgi:hypothetical protein